MAPFKNKHHPRAESFTIGPCGAVTRDQHSAIGTSSRSQSIMIALSQSGAACWFRVLCHEGVPFRDSWRACAALLVALSDNNAKPKDELIALPAGHVLRRNSKALTASLA